jgi:hypothetical protein
VVGALLVGVGTLLAAPELKKPLRAKARTIGGAIATAARAIERRLRLRRRRDASITATAAIARASADRPGTVKTLDVEDARWREHVRDLLAEVQTRLDRVEAQMEDHYVETSKDLAELREELIERIGAELETAATQHVRSRMAGALLIIVGTGLLAVAQFV